MRPAPGAALFKLDYPLSPNRRFYMESPERLSKREIERIQAILWTLEEQRQLPPGDAQDEAA